MNAFFFERASLLGLAALLVALLAQWLLDGRVPAAWRVWLWRGVLLQSALALLPLAPLRLAVLPPSPLGPVAPPFVVPHAPRLPVAAPSEPVVASAPVVSPVPHSPLPRALASSPTASVESARAPRVGSVGVPRDWDWRCFLLALYALGVGAQFVWLARSFRRVRQVLSTCISVENAALEVQLSALAGRMGVVRLPRLLESKNGAPFLVGTLRPTIVLPGALLSPENCDLEAVLSHELAHQKRRDLVWNAVMWPVQTLFWFHPLVWIARRFLLLEIESACDEMVLSSTCIAPKSYGSLLLNTMNTHHTPFAAGVADGFSALQTRLVRLNRAPKRPRRAAKIAFAALLCGALCASVPLRFVARAQVAAPAATPRPTVKPTMGVVVGPDGEPVARANVQVRVLGKPDSFSVITCDGRGRFVLPPGLSASTVRVWADEGELSTPRSTVAVPGDEVTLRLEQAHLTTIQGQVVDMKTQKPLDGALVVLSQDLGDASFPRCSTRTGTDGRFRFVGVRSSENYTLQARRNDHEGQNVSVGDISNVGLSKFIVSLQSLTATVSGRVIQADGKPARGFRVTSQSMSAEALTRRDGSFSLRLLFSGKAPLFVKAPTAKTSQSWGTVSTRAERFVKPLSANSSDSWGPVFVQAGRKDVLVRLTNAIRAKQNGQEAALQQQLKQQQKTLTGQLAPELETIGWVGTATPLSTLRGQVVLLSFGSFFERPALLDDFARSFSSRGVRVIGVQRSRALVGAPFTAIGERFPSHVDKNVSFPVANDAPLEPPGHAWWIAGESAAFYKGARYVVIGRDGRVVYPGDQLDRAITFAASASK